MNSGREKAHQLPNPFDLTGLKRVQDSPGAYTDILRNCEEGAGLERSAAGWAWRQNIARSLSFQLNLRFP